MDIDFPSSGTFISSIKESCRIVTLAAHIKVSFGTGTHFSSAFIFVFVFRFNPLSMSVVALATYPMDFVSIGHEFFSANSL
jgi:hypothetical protein